MDGVALNTESRIQSWTEPKTLAEYAEQSAGNSESVGRCANCNCEHFINGKCRHCGTVNVVAVERKKRKRPEVYADKCPRCESDDTYVNSTRSNGVRWCYCRACKGEPWKQTA